MRLLTVGLVMAFALSSCGKKKKDSDDTATATVNFKLAVSTNPANGLNLLSLEKIQNSLASSFQSVPATSSTLKSLKLYFNSIKMCQDITMNGTAMMGQVNCVTIYQGPDNFALNDTRNIKGALQAAAASDNGYIDVMNAESLKKLNQAISLNSDNTGSYKYGIVDVAGPIKVTATMIDPTDGVTPVLYTKATQPGSCRVNNQTPYDCAVAKTPMTSAPAEEAIFVGAGGGSMVTKFQQPFDISSADISNRQQYTLTLAFNPDSLVQGVTSKGATNFPPMIDATVNDGYNVGNTMALVGAQFAAVFYKTASGTSSSTATSQDANVMRESYLGTYSVGNNNGTAQLRIEFYYLSNDPQKTIYGVSTAMIPTDNTKTYLIGWQRIYSLSTNADGSINLHDYKGDKVLSNFKRVSTVGASTDGQIACDTVTFNCTQGTPIQQSFKLSALGTM